MRDPRQQIRSGVFWLGSANLAAQLIDAGSLFVVLAFLSKEDLGLATLAWSFAVILETLNGLGIASAFLQAKSVSRLQIDSVFWYALVPALFFCGLTALLAPLASDFYADPELAPMIAVSALKLPLVSAALVPLQLLNRELKFRELAAIQTCSTLICAILKIILCVAGAGAWALVWANTAYGACTLGGALLLSPLLPRLCFAWSEIRGLVSYGLKIFAQSLVYHSYRNADFLVIGRVLGNEALGVYRVAFDIAMTPAQALFLTVGRTAFPVFSRMADEPRRLAEGFLWTQRGLAFAVAPIALFLSFAAHDVLEIVSPERWAAAGPALTVLAWAAVLRSVGQLFPELYKAAGQPWLAVYQALFSAALLVSGFVAGLLLFEGAGALPVAWVWLLGQPLILWFLVRIARRSVPLSGTEFLRAFLHPAAATALAAVPAAGLYLARRGMPDAEWLSWAFVVVLAASVLTVFWLYIGRVLGMSVGDVLGRRAAPRATTSTPDT